jgi:fluoroquinolone transport system permease protein
MRLKKYNILQISLFLAVVYSVIIYFTSAQEAQSLVALLVFVDVSMMSIIMLGAGLFFEKQEGTLKSMLVSPVKLHQIVLAKIMSTVLLSLLTAVILSAVAMVAHGASINVALLLLYATLGATVHVSIGFLLTFMSKDFNSLLINYMIFVFLFTLPTLLYTLGVIPLAYRFFLFLSPSYVTQLLISTSMGVSMPIFEHLFAILYSVAIIVVLYQTVIRKKLKRYVIRG